MDREKKIELLKGIADGKGTVFNLLPWIFIINKDDKKYLSDGRYIGREISDSELNLITCPKVYIDEQDLGL